MELIQKAIELTPAAQAGIIIALGGVVEVVLGLVKSEKPLRIAYMIADACNGLAVLFKKWGEILDKVLPQRLK